jgi:predicted transcriptional regulator
MEKTTVYLPTQLKAAVTELAQRRHVPEAAIIREAIAAAVASSVRAPRGALFSGEPIAERVDELLEGLGER